MRNIISIRASKISFVALLCVLLVIQACAHNNTLSKQESVNQRQVVNQYADLAYVQYTDAKNAAQKMHIALTKLVAQANEENLLVAREAWKVARKPYLQTEVFRFGNAIVDEWEGRVNAWPLDEGLIDYVVKNSKKSADNSLYTANVIANKSLQIAGKEVDLSTINKQLLAEVLQEADGIEAKASK